MPTCIKILPSRKAYRTTRLSFLNGLLFKGLSCMSKYRHDADICLIECRFDYKSRYDEARRELAKGLSNGSIKRKFHVIEGGIERAPAAIPLLFSGGNTGKL
jgi:hypothetical protein